MKNNYRFHPACAGIEMDMMKIMCFCREFSMELRCSSTTRNMQTP